MPVAERGPPRADARNFHHNAAGGFTENFLPSLPTTWLVYTGSADGGDRRTVKLVALNIGADSRPPDLYLLTSALMDRQQ